MVFTKDQTEKEIDEIHSKYRKLYTFFIYRRLGLQFSILSNFLKICFAY